MVLAHTKALTSKGTGYADYQINIRNLNSSDKAHTPLPYDDITLEDELLIANDASDEINFTETDWGEGKDFYCESVCIYIADATDTILQNNGEGFLVTVYNSGDSDVRVHDENFVYPLAYAVRDSTAGIRYLAITASFPLRKFASGTTLKVKLYNTLGASATFEVAVNGMAIE